MSPPHVTVWHKSPLGWLVRRLQRLQFTAASFVTEHYIRDINDILRIGWLAEMQTTLAGLVVNLVIAVRLSS